MEKVIPMSWLNQILLVSSIATAVLSLVLEGWTDLAPLPIYVSISWAVFITISSVWLSCCLLRLTLKANSPITFEFMNEWIRKRLVNYLNLDSLIDKNKSTEIIYVSDSEDQGESPSQEASAKCNNNAILRDSCKNDIPLTEREREKIMDAIREIDVKCIEIWYKNISTDKSFPNEAQDLLDKFLTRLVLKANLIDKIKLVNKLANILLLHLKEYRRYESIHYLLRVFFGKNSSLISTFLRALRRVEKGAASSVEEAYKYLHPGSRSASILEHMLHHLVTVLAQEFLQWELTSSSPCKLLLSILAKKLLITIDTISCPDWLIRNLLQLLEAPANNAVATPTKQNVHCDDASIML